MSSSYIILATVLILLIIFLYISWVFVSNEITIKGEKSKKNNRRDFLYTASYTLGAIGVGGATWPMIDQMNPDASVKALSTTEVDISNINPGKTITVLWRGKPVFIRRRTKEEINKDKTQN